MIIRMENMLLFQFVVLAIGSVSCNDFVEGGNDLDSRADVFKKKWGVDHVMRDLDHIKEDIKEMVDLKHTGKLSQLEMLFYMIKIHDFDNNGGLDGIEFRVALSHTMDHDKDLTEDEKKEKMEELIENLMKVDDNNDGFVNYGELRSHLEQEERAERNKEH